MQSVAIFILFTNTQTIGVHHHYLLVPFIAYPLVIIYLYAKNCKTIFITFLIIAFLSAYSFIGSRSTAVRAIHQSIFGISENVRPIIRSDISTLKSIGAFLSETMLPADYVYVLASSDAYNDDILRNTYLPIAPPVNVSGTRHIDKRDGFPYYFFDATYVIVSDPIQTHVEPSGQRVITVLADAILSGECPNLVKIKSYKIQDDITINIYHKVFEYSPIFIEKLQNEFQNYYPDYPNLYNIKNEGNK
jgi:hypothetical protein